MAPENGRMLDWFGGLEPAWTLLGEESLNALMEEPSAENRTLRLAADLTEDELALSPVIRNASILLREINGNDGLKLTATGNLSRAAVAAMEAAMTWPGHDPAEARRYSKVLNEPDIQELHFLRTLAETAGLVEQHRGKLRADQQGRELVGSQGRALQAILFHLTFWHMNLGWFGRGMFDRWPQEQIGLVLWSLSVAADEWQAPETLVRLCHDSRATRCWSRNGMPVRSSWRRASCGRSIGSGWWSIAARTRARAPERACPMRGARARCSTASWASWSGVEGAGAARR